MKLDEKCLIDAGGLMPCPGALQAPQNLADAGWEMLVKGCGADGPRALQASPTLRAGWQGQASRAPTSSPRPSSACGLASCPASMVASSPAWSWSSSSCQNQCASRSYAPYPGNLRLTAADDMGQLTSYPLKKHGPNEYTSGPTVAYGRDQVPQRSLPA